MKKTLFMLCSFLLSAGTMQAQNDDFGLWTEIGVTKSLPHNLDVSLEGEYRLKDNLNKTDRWGATLSLGYKPFKFMKLKAGYALLYGHNDSEKKEKYTNDVVNPAFYEGYNITEAYWALRHRFKFDVTFDKKFFKCLKISLRERYQYTFRPEMQVPRLKYRFYENELKPGYPIQDMNTKRAKHTHMLRSRLQVQYDKKKCDWKPFVSFEIYNDLAQQMQSAEYKVMCGTDYKISSSHKVNLSYIYNTDMEEHPYESRHVVVVGYAYSF